MATVPTAEPDVDPSDPYVRSAQTFARLTADMVARVAVFGTEEPVAPGTLLFRQGERDADFFVVLAGTIEVFQQDPSGAPTAITVHGEHAFTGELQMFSDDKLLVSGRVVGEGRVIRVTRSAFRRLLVAEPDIGEIVTRAFIPRGRAGDRRGDRRGARVRRRGRRRRSRDDRRAPSRRGDAAQVASSSRRRGSPSCSGNLPRTPE